MRRARIKAVATVPVRRKAVQDTAEAETSKQDDVKVLKKPSEEKRESKTEPTTTVVDNKEPEKTDTSSLLEKLATSPVIQKESIEPVTPEVIKQTDSKNDIQPVSNVEVSDLPNKTVSKTDPPVESSPIKTIQGRSCFMRPTPRLDGGGRIRRNSVQGSGASASESEDDSRRSTSIAPSRIRNDSIQSLKDGGSGNANNIAKLNLGQKRRMVVSESARKLAEARREFLLKHENNPPDKSKLTMYDLIYYNPVTNPMKPKPVTRPAARKISVCSVPDKTKDNEEETVDEPTEIVVPQVKVGPNGQIILDEQSIVIDQYKARENIDRSDIIVDEDTTGNGFYKRRKKSKDWNKWETVKFYKALNTYGTDFLLMQSIFPKRTRQELKLKYKKEERLNQNLVEKALQYQEFDTEALEKDLANVEENERKESESNKKSSKKGTRSLTKKKRRKRCQIVTNEISCENELDADTNKSSGDEQSSDENSRITITKVKKRTVPKRKAAKINDSSADENAKLNSDSEPEVYKAKVTRSGRVSKKPKKLIKSQKPIKVYDTENKDQAEQLLENNNDKENDKANVINDPQNNILMESNELNVIDGSEISNVQNFQNSDQTIEMSNMEENETNNQSELLEVLKANSTATSNVFDNISEDIPNMANLKPGSLVVLKKDCIDIPGKTYMQVYIVSADYDSNNPNCKDSLLPIDLSPDVLETVTNCIKDIEPENVS
ncbi:transcription factor TFIIIB component B'' [Nasonia vitripennis]|uniref:Myb-like domain-containing protein n=1 Tax=Nasonia vitripennis TaxID=7425 RepID=A0A7M7G2D1_NASVI|nr:transcription factor TFIIIB component B'' [Nasonia vitripennis]